MGSVTGVGVVVDSRLGFLSRWNPTDIPRLLDLRLDGRYVASVLQTLPRHGGEWVLVPASRFRELPADVTEPVYWRSPVCAPDDLRGALEARPGSVFVTHSSELDGLEDLPRNILLTGFEGAGIVAEESALVLVRRVLERADCPVWVVGGLGPDAAAGVVAAGAAGVFLGDVLWATPEAECPPEMVDLLERFDESDTDTVGRHFGFGFRVYRQLATKAPKVLEGKELEAKADTGARSSCWQELLQMVSWGDADTSQNLIPLAQTSALACTLRHRFGGSAGIVAHFREVIAGAVRGIATDYPFVPGSKLAERFGVEFPVFQGPMSQVSDVPELADEIEAAGAMPWLAFSNAPDYVVAPLLEETTSLMGERSFGVNIIGMESNRYRDRHLELLYTKRPRFVMVAAGTVEQALRLEGYGITTVLHTPVRALLRSALQNGLRNFVLEGAEAGGHVGRLGLTALCQYAIDTLLAASNEGLDLSEVSVTVAGGISDRRAAHGCAAMLYRLHRKGVAVGLQLGTALLLTEEAVSSGAVSPLFQEVALRSTCTELVGRTVNTPTRVLRSDAADRIRRNEDRRLRDGVSLRVRKEHYEDDNHGGLRAAAKAQRVEYTDETREHTRLIEIDAEAQRQAGLFHCGQTVALMNRVRPARELFGELTEGPSPTQRRADASEVGTANNKMTRTASMGWRTMERPEMSNGVAIIGMGVKVPDALTVDAFWQNIVDRHYAITEVPREVWDWRRYWSEDPKEPDKSYSKIGGFVRGFEFDRKRYRIPPMVLSSIDPTQQLALAATADALEDAGLTEREFDRDRCAVILGSASGGDLREKTELRVHFPLFAQAVLAASQDEELPPAVIDRLLKSVEERFKRDLPPITEDSMPGELGNVVAGRISNAFDLRGPNFVTDAACASGIAALDSAVRGLRSGAFDLAISGGADRSMSPSVYTKFSKVGALSADLSCPFDVRASGFVMGEGAVIFVLKRLADAINDGDKVYAVIRGVGGGSDGRGKGITAPNPLGQLRSLKAAYRDADVSPNTIGLLEAHGTSTRVGDVVEAHSFGSIFDSTGAPDSPISLGSVKSNIGHLKAAAGAAGVFKAAMALHQKTLPPTGNFETPNPKIDFEDAHLRPQEESEPWERNGHPRRAGISAFGFGGTNFHIVLEELDRDRHEGRRTGKRSGQSTSRTADTAPISVTTEAHVESSSEAVERPAAVGVSASSKADLIGTLSSLITALERGDVSRFERACLPHGLSPGRCRLAVAAPTMAKTAELGRKALDALKAGKSFRVLENQGVYYRDGDDTPHGGMALLFTGQGSQYLNMGADLVDQHPEVGARFAKSDALLADLLEKPLSDYVFFGKETAEAFTALSQTQITQPAVLTLDAALFEILEKRGIQADVVAGHSLGEYGACFAAGVISTDDAIRTVAIRGAAMADCQPEGGDRGVMASLTLPAEEVGPVLSKFGRRVVIANKNSPVQTIIAGYSPEMEEAIALFESQGHRTVRLQVSHAFHTEIVSPASETLRRFLDTVPISAPSVPIRTNVNGGEYPTDPDAIRELLSRQLAEPVEWHRIIERMYADGIRTFIEVGPKAALTSFVSSCLEGQPHRAYCSNHPQIGGLLSLARLTGALWADGLLGVAKTEVGAEPHPTSLGAGLRACETPPSAATTSPSSQASETVATKPSNGSNGAGHTGMLSWAAAALTHDQPVALSAADIPDEGQTPTWEETYTVLLDELCERTGYDPDEIESDFELEADLGVDTVKQAEIMAAVREHYGLPRDESFRLADYPTLEDLAGYISARLDGLKQTPAPVAAAVETMPFEVTPAPLAPVLGAEEEDQIPTNDFEPFAIGLEPVEPVAVDIVALKALFAGRCVALVGLERSLRTNLARVLDGFQATSFILRGETGEEILAALSSATTTPERLAVVSGVGAGNPSDGGIRLFRLARALLATVPEERWHEIPWLTVTHSGGTMGLNGGGNASAGVASGCVKSLARELDSARIRVLDLGDEPMDETYARAVLAQAFLGSTLESGYAYGQRFEWVETRVSASSRKPFFGSDDVIAVTGGARGVSARVAMELARRFRCKLAILNRTPYDPRHASLDLDAEKERIREELAQKHERVTPGMVREAMTPLIRGVEAAQTLASIRDLGAEVEYFSVDATDRRAVTETIGAVRRRFGPISGVIHGAGVEVSKTLLEKSEHSARLVLDTKVTAVANLLCALRHDPLRSFVAFGSVVGRFGNAGQFEYGGANDGLSKQLSQLAQQRPNMQALTISWTAWDDVGMAVDGGTRALMLERGIDLLPADVGSKLCVDLIEAGASGEVMVAGELGDLRDAPGLTRRQQGTGRAIQEDPTSEHEVGVGDGLLETVEVSSDGKHGVAGVLLEAEEPFLNDHRIDGTPVLPGVIAVEICAQLCARLAGDKPFRGVSDMRFMRPAKLHRDDPLQLTVQAERTRALSDETVLFEAVVKSLRPGRTGREIETEHFTATLRFGGPVPGPRSPLKLSQGGELKGTLEGNEIYQHFFHTGTFTVLDELQAVGEQLAIAEGHVGDAPLSSMCGAFLTLPLVMEMAFQTAGLHGLVRDGAMLLPSRIGRSVKLQQPPQGARLTTRVAIRERDASRLIFDAEVLTDDGQVVARYSEIELVNAGDFGSKPPQLGVIDVISSTISADALTSTESLDPARLAAAEELPEYERKLSDKARREWVLSRTLAKSSVIDFYRRFYGIGLKNREIRIVKDDFGAPSLEILRDDAASTKAPRISLSHTTGRAVVVLVPPWRRALAGVDLELVEDRPQRFADDYFTEHERSVAQNHTEPQSMLTAMWTLKEAASKALGMGTYLDFRNEIEVMGVGEKAADIRFRGRAQEQLDKLGVEFARAEWSVDSGFATAQVELAGRTNEPSSAALASVMAVLLHTGKL